jgi:hypothetical protein
VQSWPVLSNSSTLVSGFLSGYAAAYGNVGVVTQPLVYVNSSTPDVSISVGSGCNNFTGGQATPNGLGATGTEVPIPSYAAGLLNGSSDNPLTIADPSANMEWELWRASYSGGQWSACWGGAMHMSTSTGVFPSPYGRSATGISYLDTMVTEADVASGHIDHAISISIQQCNAWIYPADRGDCGSDPNNLQEGSWLTWAPGTQMPSGLTPFAQMVFTAVQNYGLVVIDYAGAYVISAEQSNDWAYEGSGTDPMTTTWQGLPEYQVIDSLPWSHLEVVSPPSQMAPAA